MYKVAVVQNESELLRYSSADIRPHLATFGYEIKSFTAENITDLFSALLAHDISALVIATNACNDGNVLGALRENRDAIAEFLRAGNKGLLLGFQMKLSPRGGALLPFLPDEYGAESHYRFVGGETAQSGTLAFCDGDPPHVLLRHPNRIDINDVLSHCQGNLNTPGLYWGYLAAAPRSQLRPLICDPTAKNERRLLCASPAVDTSRVVLSTLVLDWQNHRHLLENTIRYVVEGPPHIALVTKTGVRDFGLNSLKASLVQARRAFQSCYVEHLDLGKLDLELHTDLVIDQSLRDEAFAGQNATILAKFVATNGRALSLGQDTHGLPALTVLSARNDMVGQAAVGIAWLKSRFGTGDGLWEGSFWTSIDVLHCFEAAGVSLDHYARSVLEYARRKRLADGSYDSVFAATCAMLYLYRWTGELRGPEFQVSRDWVLSQFDRQDTHGRATALEVLLAIAPETVTPQMRGTVVNAITTELSSETRTLQLLRYARTLVALENFNEAVSAVLRLPFIDEHKWENVFGAGEAAELLVKLLPRARESHEKLESALFATTEYLKDECDPQTGVWRRNVLATARALRALLAYAQFVRFPIDDVVRILGVRRPIADSLVDNKEVAESLSRLHADLSEALADNKRKTETVNQTRRMLKVAKWLIVPGLPTFQVTAMLCAYYWLHATGRWSSVTAFLLRWQDSVATPLFALLGIGSLTLYYKLFRIVGILPPISKLLRRIPALERQGKG